jgi:hypothetical protein
MQVRNLMRNPVVTVDPDQSLQQAAQAMAEHGIGSVVVEQGGQVAGILTERDVMHAAARLGDVGQARVADHMTAPVVTASPSWDVSVAAAEMHVAADQPWSRAGPRCLTALFDCRSSSTTTSKTSGDTSTIASRRSSPSPTDRSTASTPTTMATTAGRVRCGRMGCSCVLRQCERKHGRAGPPHPGAKVPSPLSRPACVPPSPTPA